MCGTQEPAGVGEALGMLDRALDVLNAADVGSLSAGVQAETLRVLGRAEAKQTAARARVLAAFTAQDGYQGDGQGSARTWLRWQTRVTRGAAAAAAGWVRRLGAHPVIWQALADGQISASWARELCGWSDRLPAGSRDDADAILAGAARGGAELADLGGLAEEMYQRSRRDCPDTDPGDGFGERGVWLDVTFRGAGRVNGDLMPGCSAALAAVLESLGKKAGPEDSRTAAQRRHDALEEACRRLIASGMLPERAGQPTQAQVHITLAQLRNLPGASGAEATWRAAAAAGHGWLTGPDAGAAACDATLAPVVTGHLDTAALDRMVRMFLDGHRIGTGPGTGPCGCRCGGCTCPAATPLPAPTLARLRGSLLAMAADVLSGPGGLASWLRRSQLPGGPRQPPVRRPAPTGHRASRAGHPRPSAPRRDHPPPALRLPRLRPARQPLPDPPSHPPLPRRPDRPAQPRAAVRLPPPHRHPPLGLDPDPAPRRHHHRHQPRPPTHLPQPRPTRPSRITASDKTRNSAHLMFPLLGQPHQPGNGQP